MLQILPGGYAVAILALEMTDLVSPVTQDGSCRILAVLPKPPTQAVAHCMGSWEKASLTAPVPSVGWIQLLKAKDK